MNLTHNDPLQATIDHTEAKSRGGLDDIRNYRLACRRCNNEKGSGVSIDFEIGPDLDPDPSPAPL